MCKGRIKGTDKYLCLACFNFRSCCPYPNFITLDISKSYFRTYGILKRSDYNLEGQCPASVPLKSAVLPIERHSKEQEIQIKYFTTPLLKTSDGEMNATVPYIETQDDSETVTDEAEKDIVTPVTPRGGMAMIVENTNTTKKRNRDSTVCASKQLPSAEKRRVPEKKESPPNTRVSLEVRPPLCGENPSP